MKLVKSQKIYDHNQYHSWTDLAVFRGAYYMTFRTGRMHTSGDGYVEVLKSQEGGTWRHCGKGIFQLGDETIGYFCVTDDKLWLFVSVSRFDPVACKKTYITSRTERTTAKVGRVRFR
jgi:hypothetical protein